MEHEFIVRVVSDVVDKALTSQDVLGILKPNIQNALEEERILGALSGGLSTEDSVDKIIVSPLHRYEPENEDLHFELLHADCVEVDDDFIRYFHVTEESELNDISSNEPIGDVVLLVADEYQFTVEEIKSANYCHIENNWSVKRIDQNSHHNQPEVLTIGLFNLAKR